MKKGIGVKVAIIKGLAMAAAVCLTGDPSNADQPAPFPEFTFKRVKPPKSGERPNLVQITPDAPSPKVTAPSDPKTGTNQELYDWFWTEISPKMDQSGPGRLSQVLAALSKPPMGQAVAAPPLSILLDIAQERNAALLLNTVGTRVSPAFALSVIAVESGGQATTTSGKGAQGLMQLIPDTAKRFGVSDALDADQNIKGGVAYLDWLLTEFKGDPVLALAAYNAGENAVKQYGGVPPFPETRAYVPKVMAAFAVARKLCKTPPELISDGCVFNLGR